MWEFNLFFGIIFLIVGCGNSSEHDLINIEDVVMTLNSLAGVLSHLS